MQSDGEIRVSAHPIEERYLLFPHLLWGSDAVLFSEKRGLTLSNCSSVNQSPWENEQRKIQRRLGRVRRRILRCVLIDALRESLPFRIIWYDNHNITISKQILATYTDIISCHVENLQVCFQMGPSGIHRWRNRLDRCRHNLASVKHRFRQVETKKEAKYRGFILMSPPKCRSIR